MAAKNLIPSTGKDKSPAVENQEQYQYPFFTFLKDMNKMIDNFFTDFGMAPASRATRPFAPAVDVVDSGKNLTVTAELPGMDQEDIDISLGKNNLTIKGEKKSEREDKGEGFHLVERSFGSFTRSITLPVEVNVDKVKATFKNGILSITLPKAEEVLKGTKKIPIKSE